MKRGLRNNKRTWNNGWRKSSMSSTLDSSSMNTIITPENAKGDDPKYQRAVQDPYSGVDIRNLPRHLYRPFGSESVDIRNLVTLNVGETFEILRFVGPKGGTITFLGYGIFSDALLEADIQFFPRVNGKRVFPYHGNPNNNFRIALGLDPSLGNDSLIGCFLTLRPDDVLTWSVTNFSAVQIDAGVRMSGFLDASNLQIEQKFGG